MYVQRHVLFGVHNHVLFLRRELVEDLSASADKILLNLLNLVLLQKKQSKTI